MGLNHSEKFMNLKLSYNEFRTGLTFKQVRQMLSIEQKRKRENFNYMFVTRATVLGRWHQLKLEMYRNYESY